MNPRQRRGTLSSEQRDQMECVAEGMSLIKNDTDDDCCVSRDRFLGGADACFEQPTRMAVVASHLRFRAVVMPRS